MVAFHNFAKFDLEKVMSNLNWKREQVVFLAPLHAAVMIRDDMKQLKKVEDGERHHRRRITKDARQETKDYYEQSEELLHRSTWRRTTKRQIIVWTEIIMNLKAN